MWADKGYRSQDKIYSGSKPLTRPTRLDRSIAQGVLAGKLYLQDEHGIRYAVAKHQGHYLILPPEKP